MLVAFDMIVQEVQPGIGPEAQLGIGARYLELDITITSPDLRNPGWTLSGFVPTGVKLLGQGLVVPHSGTQDFVSITPGAERSGLFLAILTWPSLNGGPLQVQGANLEAVFPGFVLENEAAANNGNTPAPAAPLVTLTRELQPGEGDYAYLGGQPPDHQDQIAWSWNPINGLDGTDIFPSLTIEAQSATMNEQSHNAEFLSGVFFGVAAAALIGALQEFLNSARKRKPQADGTSADT
jgi:hypothetical protein